jgi:metal-responsive CopG/Arc/MetJ family transcriptional regulator
MKQKPKKGRPVKGRRAKVVAISIDSDLLFKVDIVRFRLRMGRSAFFCEAARLMLKKKRVR